MNSPGNRTRLAIRKAPVGPFEHVMTPGAAPHLECAFSASELTRFRQNKGGAESLAARYAAKAALLEVLGVPEERLEVLGSQVEISRLPTGQPHLECRGPLQLPPGTQLVLSLTHSRTLALAAVCLQSDSALEDGSDVPSRMNRG